MRTTALVLAVLALPAAARAACNLIPASDRTFLSTLGVVSTVGMSLYERRRELAVLRALGGRRSQLTRLIALELAPLALAGLVVGAVAGYFAAMAIMGFFEASSGIDLGYAFATGSVTIAAVAVVIGIALVARTAAGRLTRRTPAAALRAS